MLAFLAEQHLKEKGKDKWNIEERRQNERQMKGKRKEKENPNEKRGLT